MSEFKHIPVMMNEVLQGLKLHDGGLYVDCTMGGAGHSEAILSCCDCRLIAIDQDEEAIFAGMQRLAPYGERKQIVRNNFGNLAEIGQQLGVMGKVDGILMDIGVSSHQLDKAERGFSYMNDAPLDMRMDKSAALSAYDVVNGYSAEELTRIFYTYGEEKWSKRIAEFIVEARNKKKIESTFELTDIIKAAIPVGAREKDQHPARRSFQALRIEVNQELAVLEKAIDAAITLLKPGGRLVIISFHSLEDRIVKERFRYLALDCICPPEFPVCRCSKKQEVKIITRKPLVPTKEEEELNPRSRSSKLRIAEKI